MADPNIMKKLQVDRGAIKFVLAGANIMCPGLTSPGGVLDDEVAQETPVVHINLFRLHAYIYNAVFAKICFFQMIIRSSWQNLMSLFF